MNYSGVRPVSKNKTIQLNVEVMEKYLGCIEDYIEQLLTHPKTRRRDDGLKEHRHHVVIAKEVIMKEGLVDLDWFLTQGNFDGMTLSACNGAKISSRFD